MIEQAIEQAGSMQLVAHQALRLTWLAQAHLLGGRRETALGRARRALHLAEDRQERGQQAYVRRLLADIDAEAERPDVAAAAAAYRGALDLAAMLQMRPLAAQCLLGLGRLHRRTGQREQAGRELADAMAQFSAMGMTLWVERAQAALDE